MASYVPTLEVTQSQFYHILLVQSKSRNPLRFKGRGLHKNVNAWNSASLESYLYTGPLPIYNASVEDMPGLNSNALCFPHSGVLTPQICPITYIHMHLPASPNHIALVPVPWTS